VPRLPTKDQTVTAEYLRSITDEDAKAQLLHPSLWSYIVRDLTGMIFYHGCCRMRRACERLAVGATDHLSTGTSWWLAFCGVAAKCNGRQTKEGAPRVYSAVTINSLWERGLLDANFMDPRVACCDLVGGTKV
jgi:hypothetical protein